MKVANTMSHNPFLVLNIQFDFFIWIFVFILKNVLPIMSLRTHKRTYPKTSEKDTGHHCVHLLNKQFAEGLPPSKHCPGSLRAIKNPRPSGGFIPAIKISGRYTGEVGLPRWLSSKESTYRRCRRWWFDPWAGKLPWKRKWQLTPVFLPGKSHGVYEAYEVAESDTIEHSTEAAIYI